MGPPFQRNYCHFIWMTFMAYVDSERSVKVNPGLLTLGQPKHRSLSTRSGYRGQLLAGPKAGGFLCNWLLPNEGFFSLILTTTVS